MHSKGEYNGAFTIVGHLCITWHEAWPNVKSERCALGKAGSRDPRMDEGKPQTRVRHKRKSVFGFVHEQRGDSSSEILEASL